MSSLWIATGEDLVQVTLSEGKGESALLIRNRAVQCLAVDPENPEKILVGTRGEGVLRSDNGGRTWVSANLPEKDVFSVAISPVDGTAYAGTEPSRLFRSVDGGKSWNELSALQEIPSRPTWSFPPRPWTSHVRWIAPSPHNASELLVGIELGGLMFSEDGGASWRDHRQGAQRDVHCVKWHPMAPGRAYEAGGGGAAWSQHPGESWTPVDEGRNLHYTWGLAIDPRDPDCWFVSASPGPREAHAGGGARARIYRWQGNGPWKALEGGLPQPLDQFPYALTFGGESLFAGLGNGAVYLSRDLGETWRALEITGPAVNSVSDRVRSNRWCGAPGCSSIWRKTSQWGSITATTAIRKSPSVISSAASRSRSQLRDNSPLA